MIIAFQFMGGIAGGFLAIFFEKLLTYRVTGSKLGDNLFVSDSDYKFTTYKSLLFQFLTMILLMFLSTFTFLSTSTMDNVSFYFGLISISFAIFFLFMMSSQIG